jgi:aminoglycoside phosphotransferase (APT) family kinase protein
VLARTGEWIRAFQTMPVEPAQPANERLADYIDIRLRRLVELPAAKFSAADRAAVLEHVHRLELPAGSEQQVPVHADLAPANVLVSGERVVVLDFAMASVGGPLLDLARLYMQIDLLRIKPRYRTSTIRRIQASLLRGFDPALHDSAPAFRLLLLRYHVNHLNTLAADTGRFPASAYNSYVRRFHRRLNANEIAAAKRGQRT